MVSFIRGCTNRSWELFFFFFGSEILSSEFSTGKQNLLVGNCSFHVLLSLSPFVNWRVKMLLCWKHQNKFVPTASKRYFPALPLTQVWSITTQCLLYTFPNEHARQSLFRNLGTGVMQIEVGPANHIFSCGADGTMKMRLLPNCFAAVDDGGSKRDVKFFI